MKDLLLWGLVFLSYMTVSQKRVFHAVLFRMALSVLAATVYFYLMAPDVALVEALIGALLMTYVYILLIRSPNLIRVGVVERKILFERREWGWDGLEYEMIRRFCSSHGYSMKIIEMKDVKEALKALESGSIDVIAGGYFEEGVRVLPTKVFVLKNGERKDILAMKTDDSKDVLDVFDSHYSIKFAEHEEEFKEFLEEMRRKGDLDRLVKKYAG